MAGWVVPVLIVFAVATFFFHFQQSDQSLPADSYESESASTLINMAFCSNQYTAHRSNHYPLHVPNVSAPWVWDAFYNKDLDVVEIVTISRQSCKFNISTWKLIVSLFPQYSNQLAYGESRNILVGGWTNGSVAYRLMLAMELAVCYYYNNYGDFVASIKSSPVKRNLKWSSAGAFVVVCPSPSSRCGSEAINCSSVADSSNSSSGSNSGVRDDVGANWTHVRIGIVSPVGTKNPGSIVLSEEFSVCNSPLKSVTRGKNGSLYTIPTVSLGSDSGVGIATESLLMTKAQNRISAATISTNKTRKPFSVVVCSATSRSPKLELLEWIEYYRLLGVEHFFIYDTCMNRAGEFRRKDHGSNAQTEVEHCSNLLSSALSYYVRSKIVTIIPWHYENCVRGMASGRGVSFLEKAEKSSMNASLTTNGAIASKYSSFSPPRAIAQTAALSSCYLRFRHLSKYIIHVDDDEFITFSPSILHHYNQSSSSSTATVQSETLKSLSHSSSVNRQPITSLHDLADGIFDLFPKAPALSFLPVFMHYSRNNGPDNSMSRKRMKLPRLGNWTEAGGSRPFEKKMLLRTDAVLMFFVHYISAWEPGNWEPKNSIILPIEYATLLHFKESSFSSGSIFGSVLPMVEGNMHEFSPKIENYSRLNEDTLNTLNRLVRLQNHR
jgi:hypothetical protein